MRILRRMFRLVKVLLWFFASGLYVSIHNRDKGWVGVACAAYWARVWASRSAKLANIKIKSHGSQEGFPGGLIVCNHQGYLDIIACASLFKIRFAPKIEIKHWPFLGWLLGLNRPVWVDRSSRQKAGEVETEIRETMLHHISMLVYPEGKTGDGSELLPFKSTPFQAVIETGRPVLPVLLFYSSDPADGDGGPLGWHGSMSFLPHVWRVLGLRSVTIDAYILPWITPLPGEDRKQLTTRLREIMACEYDRLRGRSAGEK
ncbi:MAG: lysophospholipid acyltransferase family protein [Victivallaceae bacterium]|nr:lysophospholipid acyltransferase family protein [Victivallaceae bacterium]